jgi:hypothetical protein
MAMHWLDRCGSSNELTSVTTRLVVAAASSLLAETGQAADRTFSIPFGELETWSKSITVSLETVTILGHSGVHPVQNDCEMHFGARVEAFSGDPPGWVLEPMNVCIEPFPGKTKRTKSDWLAFARSLVNKKVTAIGVPRIWQEHLVGGNETSNPNHAVELHPLTKIVIGRRSVDFSKLVYAPDGFNGGLSEATAMKILDPDQTEVTVNRSGNDVEINLQAGRIGKFTTLSLTLSADGIEEHEDGYRLNGAVPVTKGRSHPVTVIAPTGSAAYKVISQFKSSGRASVSVHDALVLFSLNLKALVEAVRGGANDAKVDNPIQFILYGVQN